MKKKITILGIETSCDETAASVIRITDAPTNYESKTNYEYTNLSNIVSSQVKIHAKIWRIVPEVAAREHAENILGVLGAALNPKQILNSKSQILNSIDAIAVTNGPGLITSLLVGVEAG